MGKFYLCFELFWCILPLVYSLKKETKNMSIVENRAVNSIVGKIGDGLAAISQPPYDAIIDADASVKQAFSIDNNTGLIRTKVRLDREEKSSYTFKILKISPIVQITINIHILDLNDNSPVFHPNFRRRSLSEISPQDVKIALGSVSDNDTGQNGIAGCEIFDGNSNNAFQLVTKRGQQMLILDLSVNAKLDYESVPFYSLLLRAWDGGSSSHESFLRVNISITDINDNYPVFPLSSYEATLLENTTIGTKIMNVTASDKDSGENGKITFSIPHSSDPENIFHIDPVLGVITLMKPLDYESVKTYSFKVCATDNGSNPLHDEAAVSIRVLNVNEHPPNILLTFLTGNETVGKISENARPGDYVARISVSDPDADTDFDAHINITLEGGEGRFTLTTQDNIVYLVLVRLPLDRELKPFYNLTISAKDSGLPSLTSTRSFVLWIDDVNDNAPNFTQLVYRAEIQEAVSKGSSVIQVTAIDIDEGNNSFVTYSIIRMPDTHSSWFQINKHTGLITTRVSSSQIDCETDAEPWIIVEAKDGGNPQLSANATVIITIRDINDNQPTFQKSYYNVTVLENTTVGTCILTVSATDPDCGIDAQLTYRIAENMGFQRPVEFAVQNISGNICVRESLDFEKNPSFDFPVQAVDRDGLYMTAMVKIMVMDVNDNRPVFDPQVYSMNMEESTQSGKVVTVRASDKDVTGMFSEIQYDILSGNEDAFFRINSQTGVISLAKPLPSGEQIFILQISAVDSGGLRAVIPANVTISITGHNARLPKFSKSTYNFTVSEDVKHYTLVGTVQAHISDGDSVLTYSILSGNQKQMFTINQTSGSIFTKNPLDHDVIPSVLLNIHAVAAEGTPVYGSAQVNITITDVNDNSPTFTVNRLNISVKEDQSTSTPFYAVHVRDEDSGRNGEVRYSLTNNHSGQFQIDAIRGEIWLLRMLNFEQRQKYKLVVVATDRGKSPLSSSMTMSINVIDVNDNAPVFLKSLYNVRVLETIELNTGFMKISASDADSGDNSRITYHLEDSPQSGKFGIFPNDSSLYVHENLDRESKSMYLLKVIAIDNGIPQLSAIAQVQIQVLDANDNDPVFTENAYSFHIVENQSVGDTAGMVTATDRDSGENARLTYSFVRPQDNFAIHPYSGEITATRTLDRERVESYKFAVCVTDHGHPAHNATAKVQVTVLDINDNAPVFQNNEDYSETVPENKPKGTEVIQVHAKDSDVGENGTVSYYFDRGEDTSGLDNFAIHPRSGLITTKEVLDYEVQNKYVLTVVARDSGSPAKESQVKVVIWVGDDNEEKPLFPSKNITFSIPENVPIRTTVGVVVAQDQDSWENGQISYYIIGGNVFGTFAINTESGEIYSIREIDYEESSSHTLGVKAVGSNVYDTESSTISVLIRVIDINDNSPKFDQDPVILHVRENPLVNQTVYTFTAADLDSGPNGTVAYSIQADEAMSHNFSVGQFTGHLMVSGLVDYETAQQVALVVEAEDQSPDPADRLKSTVTVVIFILDENDNWPQIDPKITVHVFEDEPVGFPITYLIAIDADIGNNSGNGILGYNIIAGNDDGRFHLEQISGLLTLSQSLDREEKSEFRLNISISDHGTPQRISYTLLSIFVEDVNDNAPRFEDSNYLVNINENAKVNTSVTKIRASDRDIGENGRLSYLIPQGIASDAFLVDMDTGMIRTIIPLDREVRSSYIFTAYVRDNGYPVNYDMTNLIINVTDTNDHAPVFRSALYRLKIPENTEFSVIHTFVAHDADAGLNGQVVYSILDGNEKQKFSVDSISGQLSCKALDRETVVLFNLTIAAMDRGSPPKEGHCQVIVTVKDVNDNDPVFQTYHYSAVLNEDITIGTFVVQTVATDADEGVNQDVTYTLGNDTEGLFTVDSSSGKIVTAGLFDREKKSFYSFEVVARDGGLYGPRSAAVLVNVTIKDINDNAPVFQEIPYRKNVSSNLNVNVFILTVKAEDPDEGVNSELHYSFGLGSDRISQRYFQINSRTGEITTKERLNSGALGYHNIRVVAFDRGSPPRSTTGVVEILVGSDQSSSLLRFRNHIYSASISEKVANSTTVVTVTAEHVGSPALPIIYSFVNGNEDGTFGIDHNGLIFVWTAMNLDFETSPQLRIIVEASAGNMSAYATVWINLEDANDNAPRFAQDWYISSVWEKKREGTFVTQVLATDMDQGSNGDIRYNIINGNDDDAFTIAADYSGIVKTRILLDREIHPSYHLEIEAVDGGQPPLSSTCTLRITVIDVNDNHPAFAVPKPVKISENTEVGTVIAMVTANDEDLNPILSYTIASNGSMFNIDRFTGHVTLAKPLDYEKQHQHFAIITVSDARHETKTILEVNVIDANDNAPEFKQQNYQVSLPEMTPPGSSVVKVSATDADSGQNANITYKMKITPVEGFSINLNTGLISLNKTLVYNPKQPVILLVVTAEDGGSPPLVSAVVVCLQVADMNNYTPVFTNSSYRAFVREDAARGDVVIRVTAVDRDSSRENHDVNYQISHGNIKGLFFINRKSGQILVNGVLDREKMSEYTLTVAAEDGGMPPKTSIASVIVVVEDVNDQAPQFDRQGYYSQLNETFPSDTVFLKVLARDNDAGENARIQYTITSGNDDGLFFINGITGDIMITPGMKLNYEQQKVHKLVVRATDCLHCPSSKRKLSAFSAVTVNISDINEYPPEFPISKYVRSVAEKEPVNTSIFQAYANDKDGSDYGKIEYEIVKGDFKLFQIDPHTGWITTNTIFDYEAKKRYEFVLFALDKGGLSTSIPVEINILSVDEYPPTFSQLEYSFTIPGNAKVGEFVGQVTATDRDHGEDGLIVYSFLYPDDRFLIVKINGSIFVRSDLRHSSTSTRRKREILDDVTLVVEVSSGKAASLKSRTKLSIGIDRGCTNCAVYHSGSSTGGEDKTMILIVVFVVVAAIIIVVVILVFCIVRRKYHKKHPHSTAASYGSGTTFDNLPPPTVPQRSGPPPYREVVHCNGNPTNVTTSEMSEQSGNSASSGRGSAEEEEDEEIRMINSNTCIQPQILARKATMPDSGIQQDDDNASEHCVQTHQEYLARLGIDSARIQAKNKSSFAPSIESMHQFSDEGGGEGDGMEIGNLVYEKVEIETDDELSIIENSKDQGFHDAEPHQAAALSSVINSEEEYSGSYNWDYLLDWGPQYQPLADVFDEIARLKDDSFVPKKQPVHTVPQRQVNPAFHTQVRTVPPPIITDAPPRAFSKAMSGHPSHTPSQNTSASRTDTVNMTLPTLPRSPISHESSFMSPALTPSFSPSLSPLATRSPPVSPVLGSRHASVHNTPKRPHAKRNRQTLAINGSSEPEQEIRI